MRAYSVLLLALTSLLSLTTITCDEAPMPNDGSACSAMGTTCSERSGPNCDLCSKTVDSLKVPTKTAALKISESNFQEKELMKENEGLPFLNPRKLFVMSFSALFGVSVSVLVTYFASHRLPKGASSILKRGSNKLVALLTFAANLLKYMYGKIKLFKLGTVLIGIYVIIVLYAVFSRQYLNGSAFKLSGVASESVEQMLLHTEYIYDVLTNIAPVTIFTFLVKDRHFPKTKSWFRDEYDYIIIGAGSAGSVMAARLSEMSCVDILLLEAGAEAPILTEIPGVSGLYINSYAAWKYWTTPQRNCAFGQTDNRVQWTSGKAIGGSSVINSMVHIRGGKRSYDRWAEDGATGWGYKDVLPYFMKLEDNQNMDEVDEGYHGTGGPLTVVKPYYEAELKQPILDAAKRMGYDFIDCNGRNQTGFCNFQVTVRNGLRLSSAKAYLVPAEDRPNLDILKNAFARKIVFRRQKAVGVEFEFSGSTHVVRARREIIISAGTVRTPHLLMLSGIGPCDHLRQHNISCIRNSPVGKNLQDHYGTATIYEMSGDIAPVHKKILNPLNALRFLTDRKGPYAAPEQVLLAAYVKGTNASLLDFPSTQLFWVELMISEAKSYMNPEVYNKKFSMYEGKPLYGCISIIVQAFSRGNITLASSDPHDAPAIDPNYHGDPRDMEYLLEGMKLCEAIATSEEMQKIGSTRLETVFPGCEDVQGDIHSRLECDARSLTLSHWHPTGTARMGSKEDRTSVVDPDLRVIGVENLRVVDASVMPTAPNGNTYAPTIMIAEKISDKMKQDIECVAGKH